MPHRPNSVRITTIYSLLLSRLYFAFNIGSIPNEILLFKSSEFPKPHLELHSRKFAEMLRLSHFGRR